MMGAVVSTDIRCDISGCPNWVRGAVRRKQDIRQARAAARGNGWRYVRLVGDVCPTCTPNIQTAGRKC